MKRRRVIVLGFLASLGGCLSRTLPVPPPVVESITVAECDTARCPRGGVIVTLVGSGALPEAQVIVEDTEMAARGPRGEVLGALARATDVGTWRVVLEPQRDADGNVRAPQRGDVLNVYQITPSFETSQSAFREIPRR